MNVWLLLPFIMMLTWVLIASSQCTVNWNNYSIQLLTNNTFYRIGDAVRTGYPFEYELLNRAEVYGKSMLFNYFNDPGQLPFELMFFAYCSKRGYPKINGNLNADLLIHIRLGDTNRALNQQNDVEIALNVAKNTYKVRTVLFVTALHFQKNSVTLGPGLKNMDQTFYTNQIAEALQTLDNYKRMIEKHQMVLVNVVSSKNPDNDFCQLATNKLVLPKIGGGIAWVLSRMNAFFLPNKVISFVYYGNEGLSRYENHMAVNAKLANLFYPGWELRLYTDSSKTKWEHLGYNVVVVPNAKKVTGGDLIRLRMLVAVDPFVDIYIVRDLDSLLSSREAAAVHEWIYSDKLFHSMHDHPAHNCCKLMAGMWGGKTQVPNLKKLLATHVEGNDQSFLEKVVWPFVRTSLMEHRSFGKEDNPSTLLFPTARKGLEFVGAVIPSRYNDVLSLKHALKRQ